MKRRWMFVPLFTLACVLTLPSLSRAAVYEASTLHNSVSRSETVLDLFFDRWNRIQDMELYFDWYGKINWVNNFQVNAVNAGTGKTEAVDMTLVRAYGSITINIPLLGGYDAENMRERLKYGTGKVDQFKPGGQQAQPEQGAIAGLWKPKNLILGLTATGFHYGLTRKGTVDRGAADDQTFTDYKYTQFFDDIFAASLLYRPYFHIHCGVIINRMIEPNDDGTMSYSNTSDMTKRFFVSSNLLSFLNVNSTVRSSEMESLAVGLLINQVVGFINENAGEAMPKLTITYKQIRLFNDEAYDPVWVGSVYYFGGEKTPEMPDDAREEAKLHTLSVQLAGNIAQYLYYDFFSEFQRPDETLYDRQTSEEIDYSPVREFRAILGWNFMGANVQQGEMFVASAGVSRYWDPAIRIHRDSGEGYAAWGGMFMLEGRLFVYGVPLGFSATVSRNYSGELRKLVETVDKWVYEGSLNVSF